MYSLGLKKHQKSSMNLLSTMIARAFPIILAFFASPVSAQEEKYTLLAPLPFLGTNAPNLTEYLRAMYLIGIGLAAMFAVIYIIWGGIEYIWSATPFGKNTGKSRIQNAFIGLLLALSSYLILSTIDPNLVKFSASIDPLEIKLQAPKVMNREYSDYLNALDQSRKDFSTWNDTNLQIAKKQEEIDKLSATEEDSVANSARIQELVRERDALKVKADEQWIGARKNNIDLAYKRAVDAIENPYDPKLGYLGFSIDNEKRTPEQTAKIISEVKTQMTKAYDDVINDLKAKNADPEVIQKFEAEKTYKTKSIERLQLTNNGNYIEDHEKNPTKSSTAQLNGALEKLNLRAISAKEIKDQALREQYLREIAEDNKKIQEALRNNVGKQSTDDAFSPSY